MALAGKNEDEKKVARKFTKKTPEHKRLAKMFAEQKIKPTDKPSDTRANDPIFQAFAPTQFRSQFNKLKIVHGACTKRGFRTLMANDAAGPGGATGGDEEEEDEDEDDEVEASLPRIAGLKIDGVIAAGIFGNHKLLEWSPKRIVKEWLNKDGVRNITLIIAMTGGAADADSGGVECKVTHDGKAFVMSEAWSELMVNMEQFYKPLEGHRAHDETEDEFNRRRYNMEDQVKIMLDASNSKDHTLTSVFRLELPFAVDPSSLRTRILGTRDGSCFCHVDMNEKTKFKTQKVMMIEPIRKRSQDDATPAKYSGLNY